MNTWQQFTLKNICNIYTGGTPSTRNSDYWNGNVNWMSSGEVNKRRIYYTDKKISEKGLNNSNARILPKGTVMIALAGQGKTRGKAAILAIDTTCNQSLAGLLTKDVNVLEPEYLFQYLEKEYENLRGLSGGEGRSGLNLKLIGDYPIKLPPIEQQKKISKILLSVDEVVEKTDQIIQKAEILKKGLMQELFTKGIGHKKFKKTKIGEIPEDWEVDQLSNVAKVERGKFSHRPRNDPKFFGGKVPFIQTGDVVNTNGKISSFIQTLNEDGLKVSKLFKKGTIVLTIAANIGDTGILEFDACFPDSLVGITPTEKVDRFYLEYFLRFRKNYLNSIATQSAQKNINLEKLNPTLISIPPKKEQQKIAKILSAVDEKNEINKKIKEKLLRLKKGLMQDIFSQKVEAN